LIASEQIATLITALGTSIGPDFNVEKLRYHRLIIMTDADVDGAHIRTLLLTLLYRQMPELVQRGYVYIAQPPLYKVKVGREERYLKDDQEEAQFMLQQALKDAEIISGGNIIRGEELTDLASQYVAADGVIARLSKVFDVGALSAMAEGVEINLETAESTADSAKRLAEAMRDPISGNGVDVVPQFDEATERHRLSVQRMHHGNVRVSIIDADFVNGSDYAILSKAAKSFLGKVGTRSMAARGEGEKRKEQTVSDFREAMQWLRSEAERGISKQRYKGLGEMNPEQLWETTMDPKVRRLLRVQIEDAIAADEVFTTLMGDDVEPRRAFIERNALSAGNIDA
ncbi:toprim domain-containing protein, partial [Achromobacter spanius]